MAAVGQPITLGSFLHETGLDASELYKAGRSFSALKHAAGLTPEHVAEARRVGSFTHVDDSGRIRGCREALTGKADEGTYAKMMAFTLTQTASLANVYPAVREELLELLSALESGALHRPLIAEDLAFSLQCHYSRDEIVGAFRGNPASMRQGTFYVEELGLDIHMVTLRKSEREFSPTTRYADYFVAPDQLHWESQSTTTADSPTGRRLIQGTGRHLFFIREDRVQDGRTGPFMCVGFGRPIFSEGEKPITLIWRLDSNVPDHCYVRFKAAAG